MNKHTLKALKGSIEKWEKIVTGFGKDDSTLNCPLCEEFYNKTSDDLDNCAGCPVSASTLKSFCAETPYETWAKYVFTDHGKCAPVGPFDEASQKIAESELAFLKGLLPR